MTVIETMDLKKSYHKHLVVRGIDLQVQEGEIFGFLGRNGAGKTTFINMLTGIVLPTSGQFRILGVSNNQLDRVKHKVGVLPDYTEFYGNDTALEHLQFFAKLQKHKVTKQQCVDLLEQVGLKNAVHVKTKKFSFGMKKKLGVAQAVVGNPDLIFLDEPTSGMDPESALEMQKFIRTLASQNKTIFMTSHNLNEVEKLCSRIAIMKNGFISGLGTIDQLQKQFQTTIETTIKLLPKNDTLYRHAREEIEAWTTINYSDNQHITVAIRDESDIASIVHSLCKFDTDIFDIQTNRPSLEEIFMND
ncbi:MAG: ABC transporter ATP-binding protein [Lysinibacillus fusiformis]|nr:ABC transporter ATP-binding protein [Lysinibacillus fusiformis]MCT6929119.1 ABC transporter ATP-binding protein [Lysinibacillus fusiformis]MCT6931977.1 ABC transporter ATP-binding protein [Lysinibacillus fusiformis]